MTILFLIIGIGLLVVLPIAWAGNWTFSSADPPDHWRYAWRLRWPVGVALGIASLFMFYSEYGTDGLWYYVYGIPFLAFVFDENGHDYVGPLTLPAIAMNAVMWMFFPHLPLWASSFAFKQRITTELPDQAKSP